MLATLLVLAPMTSAGSAQEGAGPADAEFAALVARYRQGDFQGSVASLTGWPPDRIRATARRLTLNRGDLRQIEAAAMLCSDASMVVATTNQSRSNLFLEWARALARVLPDSAAGRFKERWQAYAIGPFFAQKNLTLSRLAVRRAVADYPRSADLQLLQGVVLELTARVETSDVRGEWNVPSATDAARITSRIESNLTAAT